MLTFTSPSRPPSRPTIQAVATLEAINSTVIDACNAVSQAVLAGARASQFAFVNQGNLVAHTYQEMAHCIAECVIQKNGSAYVKDCSSSTSTPILPFSYVSGIPFISGLFYDIVIDAAQVASLDVGGELYAINNDYNGAFIEYDPDGLNALFAPMDAVRRGGILVFRCFILSLDMNAFSAHTPTSAHHSRPTQSATMTLRSRPS